MHAAQSIRAGGMGPVVAVAFALATATAAWLGGQLVTLGGGVLLVAPACGFVAAFVLARARPPSIPLLLLAGLSAGGGAILSGASLTTATAMALQLCVTVAVAARVQPSARRRGLDLARMADLRRYAIVAVGLAPLAGVLTRGMALLVLGQPPTAALLVHYSLPFAVAMAILVPPVLLGSNALRQVLHWRGIAVLALLAAAATLLFTQSQLPNLLLIPPLLLVVGRQGMPGATLALLIVGVIAGSASLAGYGRHALAGGLADRAMTVQLYLLALAGSTLPLAALLAGRQRLAATLRESRARGQERRTLLCATLASMEQGLIAFDRHHRLLASNGRYRDMLQVPSTLLQPGTHFLALARFFAARGDLGEGDRELLAQARYASVFSDGQRRVQRRGLNGAMLEWARRELPGGGHVHTFTDVTEQVLREQRIADSEAQFRLLAEHSGDVVARIALDGTPRYVSPAVLRVLAWSPEQLVGQPLAAFVHADDLDWVDSTFAALAAGDAEEATATWRFLRPDGSHAWVEAHVTLLRHPGTGQPAEVIATLRDATDRKATEAELLAAFEQMQTAALSDGLTGLANRRRFDDVLAREWRRAVRDGLTLSILLVDADRFKLFNDRYGHAAGDGCLRQIAAVLMDAARRAGDVAARYGGEEFALILPGTDAAGAAEVAERIRRDVMDAGIVHAGNLPSRVATISIGVATLQPGFDPAPSTDDLLRAADTALYAAKGSGRNRVMIEAPTLAKAA